MKLIHPWYSDPYYGFRTTTGVLDLSEVVEKPTYVDPLKYIQNYKRRSKSILAVLLDATSLSEIRIPTPKPESPDLDELSEILYECDENGAPLRCWRDQCRGHWKSPRWAEDLT